MSRPFQCQAVQVKVAKDLCPLHADSLLANGHWLIIGELEVALGWAERLAGQREVTVLALGEPPFMNPRNAGAGSDHDDGRVPVFRQTKLRGVWKNGHRHMIGPFREEGGANAFALSPVTLVFHHIDGQVDGLPTPTGSIAIPLMIAPARPAGRWSR